MVKYKKGHLPALVKNLMKIGRKENAEDLHMLGFEVEFLVCKRSLMCFLSSFSPVGEELILAYLVFFYFL
jgi:hypothetical protein